MGRELQKKKRKSGLHKVRQKPKKTQKPLLANHLISTHWDKSQTLSQNYKRLGLTSKLNNSTGGTERHQLAALTDEELRRTNKDRLAINRSGPKEFNVTEVKIQRDPDTGAILKVIDEVVVRKKEQGPYKPLEDTIEDIERIVDPELKTDESKPNDGSIIKNLADQAAVPSAPKKRTQSDREKSFIAKLIDAYGTDEKSGCYEAMARDRDINIMQQSAGDLRKRVRKYLKARSGSN